VSGSLAVPEGDPAALEELAARLQMAASGAGSLGASTRQVTTQVRSDAQWTGDGADAFTSYGDDLGQGAGAAEGPMSRIATAVQDYAGYLRTAQQEAQNYTSLAQAAQATSDGGLISEAELAGEKAQAAISAWQEAGSRAASQVSAAAGDLSDVFGNGPVRGWIAGNSVPGSLADIPGAGDPLGPDANGTPIGEFGPDINDPPIGEFGPDVNDPPLGEFGPDVPVTPVGEFGPDVLGPGIFGTPGGEFGPGSSGTPGGLLGPLINFSKTGPESDEGGGQGSEPEPGDDEEPPDPAEVANKGALRKLGDDEVEEAVGDAHEFKEDILGKGAPISRYNIYVDKSSGYLFIMGRGKGSQPIPTYVNIGDDE
jgi:uncharacterized protein YukE